jgi:hypothetical protein
MNVFLVVYLPLYQDANILERVLMAKARDLGIITGHTQLLRKKKRTFSASKHENSKFFPIFVDHFTLLDPDPLT